MADFVIMILVIFVVLFIILRYMKNNRKRKGKKYASFCNDCSMANRCLKVKNIVNKKENK